jgi:hypothetical protein
MNNYQKYIDYINNCKSLVPIKVFDEDWEPIGKYVRREMKDIGISREDDGIISLNYPHEILKQ